jgi:hypothetical protein
MKHTIMLVLLGVVLTVAGFGTGKTGPLLVWLGVDFLLLGAAHFLKAHRLFGKRADGTLPLWSWVVFLPLFALTGLVWHIARILTAEPAVNRVSADLVVGRRLLAREKPGEFSNYVDLTAEFAEPRPLREATGYVAFPILDACAPSPRQLREAVAGLRPGTTFIHCAQGHGRTGLFALAVLLQSGAVRTVDEGLALLAEVRPAIRLSAVQVNCIRAYAGELL